MSPDLDLLHLMEVQRHEQIDGNYWVGGHVFLTSIDRQGVTQRVVHRWEEDEVGKIITPLPIDWKAWRAAREAAAPVSFVSRLKRQMQEKRKRKLSKA